MTTKTVQVGQPLHTGFLYNKKILHILYGRKEEKKGRKKRRGKKMKNTEVRKK